MVACSFKLYEDQLHQARYSKVNIIILWLKVTKTSPVANIVSVVYTISGMALLAM